MRETTGAAAGPLRSVVKENDGLFPRVFFADASETKEPGAKKLVQARLPFKRLDPLSRQNGPGTPNAKRAKLSPSNLSKEALPKAKLVSLYEGDNAVSSSSEHVNHKDSARCDRTGGNLPLLRGPLDKLITSAQERHISTTNVIDLTEESNDGLREQAAAAVAASNAVDQDKGCGVIKPEALIISNAEITSEPKMESSTSMDLKPEVTVVDVNPMPLDDSALSTKSNSSEVKPEIEGHEQNCTVAEDLDISSEPMDVAENNSENAQDSKTLESSKISDASKCVEICTTIKEDKEHEEETSKGEDEDTSQEEAEEPQSENVTQPESLELVKPSECVATPQRKRPLSPATSRNDCPDTPVSGFSTTLSSLDISTNLSSEESLSRDNSPAACNSLLSATSSSLKLGSVKKRPGVRKQKMAELEQKQRHRQEEKVEKERQREEARLAREESRRKIKEEREQKEQEKAEKSKLKEEKKREKQEAIELKQEEKRKKEEEKSKMEEEKRMKKEKSKEAFASFFTKGKTPQAPKTLTGTCGPFAPFEIKNNMRVAPVRRVEVLISAVDEAIESQAAQNLYLHELKRRKPKTSKKTYPYANSICTAQLESELEVIEKVTANRVSVEERKRFGRMKLLQFNENNRPAYWGTWSKCSKHINPRNPLAKDKELLDYEVDSDDEWEEEEPGESISHSEGEQDDEEDDDDDDDDGFFVPHGHLSDGEGVSDGEGKLSAETKKLRERLKAKEWDDLTRTHRCQRLEPVVIGCVWEGEGADSAALQKLLPYKGQRFNLGAEEEEEKENAQETKQLRDIQILRDLLPLVHGNINCSKFMIDEFQAWWLQREAQEESPPKETPLDTKKRHRNRWDTALPSKMRLKRLIKESAVYRKRNELKRVCWYVHADVLLKYGLQDLPVPSRWNYVTSPPVRERDGEAGSAVPTQSSGTSPAAAAAREGGRKMAASTPVNTRKITAFIHKQEPGKAVSDVKLDQADPAGDDCMILEEQEATLPCNESTDVVPQVPAESLH
uniref:Chromatin assembly factor 1 subunit A isoform X2 n=1 Tax=Petromyzon marinus TaxID=7757 RepID=A0AAJ7TY67_PETMA|nr:chromatin assembly factor 1 subunit A isoform X2 [Petromyzon marinus]